MSETPPSGTGRARGRARGRPPPSAGAGLGQQQVEHSPPQPSSSGGGDGGNGNEGNGGNGNGAAVRGRAGYRRVQGEPLKTLPSNIKSTRGEGGTAVRISSNYIALRTPKDVIVYDYHVRFEPEIESIRMRRALLYDHKEAFSQTFIFDGMSNIKSTKLLDGLDQSNERELLSTRRTDSAQIRIVVRHVAEVSWGHPEMLRLLNTQQRRNMQYLKYLLIGRHFFDPTIRHKISSHRLEVWQGVLTAINQHDGGNIFMVCDTVHKVIRSDTVYDVLQELLKRDRQGFQDAARRELGGQIVMTAYNNKTYRIDDIAFDKNPTFEFERKQGKISIKNYYREQYSVNIRDERQPLLIGLPSVRQARAGDTAQILLVPELCSMTGLSESLRSDFDVRKQMTAMTQADPNQRVQNLEKFIRTLNSNSDVKRDMQAWGISYEPNIVEIQGRRLDSEKILVKDHTTAATGISFNQKTSDFSKEIRGQGMFVGVQIRDWCIICTQRDRNLCDEFSTTLNRVCRPMEVILSRPQVQAIENDRTSTYVDACKSVPPKMEIVVIIVSNNNKERYDAIKKIFCCEHPLPSQVVVARSLQKKQTLMSICTKIGVQLACKLGGEAWALDIPPKELMVVGFDVHRDSSLRSKTIGGFVCSVNPHLTKWYSRVAYHEGKEELSSNFKAHFTNGLKRYWDINKKLPQRIVIYRDGVGEGDIQYVFEHELKQIQDAIKQIGEAGKSIKLAFIIVTKRVNARFFLRTGERLYENPSPGTVIDNTVTREERYDFYLISQSVRQGTVVPTMYNIIKDDTNWRPNHHQQLAYKLTHLYYNWMGTIRVPAPCQYAHKLAYLTGTALHREPNTRLSDTLFYL